MNTRNQREIDAIADVEAAAAGAGFATEAVDRTEEGNARAARRHQERLDAAVAVDTTAAQFIPPTFIDNPVPASLLDDGRTEPGLELPVPEFEVPAATTDTAVDALRVYLANCWNQETVDEAAYNAVKHLEVETIPTETTGLVLRDPRSNDTVGVGFLPDTNKQAVMGDINITAAQALNRARIAMTSDLMRTQGIDEVHGTEMDKALLLLAAQDVGLTINNIPVIAPEVMNEARQQWAGMVALAAVREGASLEEAIAVAEVLTPDAPGSNPHIDLSKATLDDGADGREALKDTPAPSVDGFPATQPMTYEGEAVANETPVPGVHAATVAATETATAPAVPRASAPPVGIEVPVLGLDQIVPKSELMDFVPQTVALSASETPDPAAIAAAPVVEAPTVTVVVEAVAETAPVESDPSQELRPEVLAVLGDESRLSKAAYLDIRQRMKAPKSSLFSEDGFVSLGSIRSVFRAAGKTDGSTAMAMTALQALEADGVIYKTTAPTTVYRATVNTHAKSDVLHPPRVMPQ